jgi:hypothetical protein
MYYIIANYRRVNGWVSDKYDCVGVCLMVSVKTAHCKLHGMASMKVTEYYG